MTEYVLVELGSALSHSTNRDRYVPFVELLLNDPETIYLPASAQLFRRGRQLFAARPDKNWSLVDCISFSVMKQRRLTDALTADPISNRPASGPCCGWRAFDEAVDRDSVFRRISA